MGNQCASGACLGEDTCGCSSNDHCSSGQVCHLGDNKCYSSGLTYEQDCLADNGDDVDARCVSGFCRTTDNKCGCTSADHCDSSEVCQTSTNTCVDCLTSDDCSSGEACHSDNKCYVSDLSHGESCLVDGDPVEARCASGICFSTVDTCGCTSSDHCSSGKSAFVLFLCVWFVVSMKYL